MTQKTPEQIDRDAQIYQISTLVAGGFKLRDVLDKLSMAAAKITDAKACAIRLLSDETGDLKMRSTYGLSEQYRNKGDVTIEDPVIQAAFTGQAVVIDDSRKDRRIIYRKETINENLISQLTVALVFKNKPIGVLRLYRDHQGGFDEDDIALARLVASQCAIAITNAKLYSKALEGAKVSEQMRLAGIIQRRMIPDSSPWIKGLQLKAFYEPCFQIGGDLYDFIQIDDNTLVIAMADVIGKGIPAAMMMSMFRGSIRAYADGGFKRHQMTEIIKKLNRVAYRECRNGEFITLFLAEIDLKKMQMKYCNCGHEPALLMRNKKIAELQKGGMVLGILKETDYKIGILKLKKDDAVVIYTDGLIDAVNFEGQFWGKERMVQVLHRSHQLGADEIIGNLLGYRRRFVGLARQIDDTSIVAITISPEQKQRFPGKII
jgi:serine phosphatase RsbU (regulator of sigma subunit)